MKQYQKSEKSSNTKKWLFAAVISVMITVTLAVSVFVYFFAPKNDGIYTVTIPNFVGKSLNGADGYENIDVVTQWINSDEIPEGIVISQEPYASAKRKIHEGENYTVKLTVSLGERRETMPELISMPYLTAAAALRTLGARVRTVTIYSDGDDGLVRDTEPRAGTALHDGELVTLYVNRKRGEKSICVPDFCNMTLGEAMTEALSIGLYSISPEGVDGSELVTSQSIKKGSYVKKGSYIAFGTGDIADIEDKKETEAGGE